MNKNTETPENLEKIEKKTDERPVRKNPFDFGLITYYMHGQTIKVKL